MAFPLAQNVQVSYSDLRRTETIVIRGSEVAEFYRAKVRQYTTGEVDINPDQEPIQVNAAELATLLLQWDALPQYHAIFGTREKLAEAMQLTLKALAFMGDAADKRRMAQ